MSDSCQVAAWVLTTVATSPNSPTTLHSASMVCPHAMVRVCAPNSLSRCQVRPESLESTPSRISRT